MTVLTKRGDRMILTDIVDDKEYRMVFDLTLKRPACVLLQAAYGCDSSIPHLFNTDTWLLAPTDDMRIYCITGNDLKQAVAMVNKKVIK
jgi:hypothetical protein